MLTNFGRRKRTLGYLTPSCVDEALEILARGGVFVIAGATDFYPARDAGPMPKLMDITAIPGLRGIRKEGGSWRIGATTTWSQIATAALPPAFDALRQAAAQVGAVQVRNVATIAGNLCNASPAADGVPPLLVLEAEVELASARGRRRLALSRFITGPRQTALAPDELLVALHIPAPPERARSAFLKIGSRKHQVISFAMAAALIAPDAGRIGTARVAVGACSPVVCRLPGLEQALKGRPLAVLAEPGLARDEHLSPLSPIADIRADAAWRREAAGVLAGRALNAAGGPADG